MATDEDTEANNRSITARSALILYGSETGNAQDVANEIGHLARRHRFRVVVAEFDSAELVDLVKHDIVLGVISTAGQGELPQNARSFWRLLLSNKLRPGVLSNVIFTTFGLGDSSYARYNIASRMLHGRLRQLGAKEFCPRGEGNEQHPEGHSAGLRTWTPSLEQAFYTQYPLPLGQDVLAQNFFIEPDWNLVRVNTDAGRVTPSTSALVPDETLVPVTNTLVATVKANRRITPKDHDQDVRLLQLETPGLHDYQPGAVAVIYPKNFPTDVQQFIELMDWQNDADVPLRLVVSRDYQDLAIVCPSPLDHIDLDAYHDTLTLRTLLTNHLDIMSVPRRYFFCSLVHFVRDGTEVEQLEKERLLELANPELIDELWDYTTRPRRTILEVMQDFTTIKIPWRYVLSVLPIMRGRQFSIASGGAQKGLHDATDGGRHTVVQLLIAIANPPSPIIKFRKRHGVCTRYVTTIKAGQRLRVLLQPGYLNLRTGHERSPAILVGPGTGVAPLRSLVHERLAKLLDTNPPSQDYKTLLSQTRLFFGCRKSCADHFFADEWDSLTHKYGLIVHTAFSREPGKPKTYVQDEIRAQGSYVYDALVNYNGIIFVCGSSGNMPKGVRQAFVDVLSAFGDADEAWAEEYLQMMEKQGRYKQETW